MYSNKMGLTTQQAKTNTILLVLIALLAATTENRTINFAKIPSFTWQLCGNGIKEGMEQCDDGNSGDMDGCSSACLLQEGYKCKTEPPFSKSLCFLDIRPNNRVLVGENGTNIQVCGNTVLETGQECDDGNLNNGDGCSSTCQIQTGFRCILVLATSQCRSICGDGLVVGKEQCDDGNVKSGDGCSSSCKVEAGYSCEYSNVSRKSICCINGTEYSAATDSCANMTSNTTSSNTTNATDPNNTAGSNSTNMTNSTVNPSNTTNNATADNTTSIVDNQTSTNATTNGTSNSTASNTTDPTNSTNPNNTTINNQTSLDNTTNASSQTNSSNTTTSNQTNATNASNTTASNQTNTSNATSNTTSNATTSNQTGPNNSTTNNQTNLDNTTNASSQTNTSTSNTSNATVSNQTTANTTTNNITNTTSNNQTNGTNTTTTQISSPFTVSLFIKIPNQNAILVQLSSARLLAQASLLIHANFPYQNYEIKQSPTNTLILQFNYNVSLNDYSQLYFTINNQTVSLPAVTSNNLALKYYPPQYYSIYNTFSILMPVFAYVILILLVLTFLFSSKLIAVQTLLIFQFTFGGLLMMRKIQSIMYPFKELWIFDGFNIRNHYESYVPPRIGALDMTSDFISNFNISIAVYLLPLVIAAIISIKKLRLTKYRAVILGEWQLSALLICIQQLVFAFVINIQYSQTPAFGIIFGLMLLLLYLFYMYRLYDRKKQAHLTTKNQFGDFKQFFQVNFLNFYVFSMVYRLSLSLVLVLMSQSIISQSLALVLTVSWAAIIIIKRPYKRSSKLIPIVNSLIMVLISIFYLYQRNKADSPQINFATFMPITLICILGLTCIFNTFYAGMHFRSLRRRRQEMKRRMKEHNMSNNVSSLVDISHQYIENGMSVVISDLTNNSHIIGKEFMDPGHNHQSTDFKIISQIKPRQFGSNMLEISQEYQRQKGIITLQGLQQQRKQDSSSVQANIE